MENSNQNQNQVGDIYEEDLPDYSGGGGQQIETDRNQQQPQQQFTSAIDKSFLEGQGIQDEDFMSFMFRSRGIDPNNIEFVDPDGTSKSRKFDELPNQEKLDVLFNDEKDPAYDFTDDEIDMINGWRKNGISPNEYMDMKINDAMKQYEERTSVSGVDMDNFTDDEVFKANFKVENPNSTDEQAEKALYAAKSDADTFELIVDGIRNKYEEMSRKKIENASKYKNAVNESADRKMREGFETKLNDEDFLNLDSVSIKLTDDEKKRISAFVFDKDKNGKSQLDYSLKNPKFLAKMAYYALFADSNFNNFAKQYEERVNNVAKSAYNDGFAAGGGRNTVRYSSTRTVGSPNPNQRKEVSEIGEFDY